MEKRKKEKKEGKKKKGKKGKRHSFEASENGVLSPTLSNRKLRSNQESNGSLFYERIVGKERGRERSNKLTLGKLQPRFNTRRGREKCQSLEGNIYTEAFLKMSSGYFFSKN